DTVSFTFDLGEPKKIGRVDVWPAKPPYGVAVSPFGFPGRVVVERSDDPDFDTVTEVLPEASVGNQISGSVLKFFARNEESRYIRVTMTDLEVQYGHRVLGLGEISVTAYNRVHPITEEIRMDGIPDLFRDQLPRLTDGFSQQRRILSQADRIKGLAQRRPLDRRLEETVALLEEAIEKWNETKRGLVIASIATLIAVSLLVFYFQSRRRRDSINAMRKQITRDLHDEVGSSMGSIWLSAERMEKLADDSETRQELSDLSLMAREASASLLEVVWESDQSELRFDALVKKLVSRAERVLQGREMIVDVSETLPSCVVSLGAKRHIAMFFKEAIHNCARHSDAGRVTIRVMEEAGEMVFSIEDNGCGFETEEPSSGWGLTNLRNRAEEIGGKAEIDSMVGKGTTVVLRVPLATLPNEPKRAYRTSN
ncbi:MAG: ATP-binding protein, partial [Verrucomicrobiota bacterium]